LQSLSKGAKNKKTESNTYLILKNHHHHHFLTNLDSKISLVLQQNYTTQPEMETLTSSKRLVFALDISILSSHKLSIPCSHLFFLNHNTCVDNVMAPECQFCYKGVCAISKTSSPGKKNNKTTFWLHN